jgi:hypothetical protein
MVMLATAPESGCQDFPSTRFVTKYPPLTLEEGLKISVVLQVAAKQAASAQSFFLWKA